MFARIKKSGRHQYVQLVHNERLEGRVTQRVIATLGRLDELQQSGQLASITESLAKFAPHLAVLNLARQQAVDAQAVHLGPVLVFERLWQELGVPQIIDRLLEGRRFAFPLERALFMTVLHRLFVSGSDRAAEYWCRRYAISDVEALQLQHLYRTMGWLGEPLIGSTDDADALGPRTRKDLIEEALFSRRKNLFSKLKLVFMDTTTLYFEGQGGVGLRQRGYSKDHRTENYQVVVVLVLDDEGRPLCSDVLPGNTIDVSVLLPLVHRLRKRFGVEDVCIVADRGMISNGIIRGLEEQGWGYILGTRMRNTKEVWDVVLCDEGPYEIVHGPRVTSKDPAPLQVKEVVVQNRRYVVCHNEDQARKDRADREAMLAQLKERLQQRGGTSVIGNRGYRRYVKKMAAEAVTLDEEKIREEAKFDGKWVLRTNTQLPPEEVALRYKDLLLVEQMFRTMKSGIHTRPIFHQCDDNVRGHVFCSFLALVLLKELFMRLEARGWTVEWQRLRDDLDQLKEMTIQTQDKQFIVRTSPQGDTAKALKAVGVALGPTVRLAP